MRIFQKANMATFLHIERDVELMIFMTFFYKMSSAIILCLSIATALQAQTRLTLDECRDMAVKNSKTLEQARTSVEMAGYDRKIARANYYPNISATGAYLYNEKDLSLISDRMSAALTGAGPAIHSAVTGKLTEITQAIQQLPGGAEILQSPIFQAIAAEVAKGDLSSAISKIGNEINDAFQLEVNNVFVGAVSLQQPIFVGGKIINANKIAKLAEDLSKSRYDQEYQDLIVKVDEAYWQVVSISNKKKLAENFSDLLSKMQRDVDISVKAGVATKSDALSIKVKSNEADMMKTKATNGLTLAKMLLCKEIGIDLNSDITLADEGLDAVPTPQMSPEKDMEQIFEDRPETRSLSLATDIYAKKVRIERADMMPKVALTANYLMSNPSSFHGFDNVWGGMFSVGVAINIPIFHGFEALQKTRKAKAEATIYRSRLEDAKEMINLQVTQLRKQLDEALEKVEMAENNLASAEENLRTASIGFEAGVVTANTALAAHTAWLQAHSEYIDAGIELQMTHVNLQKAEGNYITTADNGKQQQ